jgi:hypothetical protein
MDILKRIHEAVSRKGPEIWILQLDNTQAQKALSVKQFLAQELITEVEHSSISPDLARNDLQLSPKTVCLKGPKISG